MHQYRSFLQTEENIVPFLLKSKTNLIFYQINQTLDLHINSILGFEAGCIHWVEMNFQPSDSESDWHFNKHIPVFKAWQLNQVAFRFFTGLRMVNVHKKSCR